MKKFETFYFESYDFNELLWEAIFRYSFDEEIFFEEKIFLPPSSDFIQKNNEREVIGGILSHIHLALWMSYYKLFPTTKLISKQLYLTDDHKSFWKKFYKNGLGEFLYVNNIDYKNLFCFENHFDLCDTGVNKKYHKIQLGENILVPLWWGKDSLVTMGLLEERWKSFDTFVFWKIDTIKQNCWDLAGKKVFLCKRELSSMLFEMNQQGYYNGHVAITGMIAFVLLLIWYIYDYKYLVLSNEKSANFGNTLFWDLEVNHQYSKSWEFEKDFQKYITDNISDELKYFSLLRWMYETKIAHIFSRKCKKYFWYFSSCNNNFKIYNSDQESTTIWCNSCPKCFFVFAILYPYLTHEEVIQIFGTDLFDLQWGEDIFAELLGLSGIKPLECVGESQEVLYAFWKTLQNKPETKQKYILKYFEKQILQRDTKGFFHKLEKKLETLYDDDIIPETIKKILI